MGTITSLTIRKLVVVLNYYLKSNCVGFLYGFMYRHTKKYPLPFQLNYQEKARLTLSVINNILPIPNCQVGLIY